MLTHFTRVERQVVQDYGQVGAGTVVEFIPRGKTSIIRPQRAKIGDDIVSVTVCGDSLTGDHIFDGDRLTLRLNFEMAEVRNGRLAVIKLPCGALTVKYFFLEDDGRRLKVILKAANPAYSDQEFEPEEIEIKALVMESVRRWE